MRCGRWLLAVPVVLATSATAAPMFQPLGFVPGRGSFSDAFDVSDDGTTVVGVSAYVDPIDPSLDAYEAFRWRAGTGMVGLGDLPGGPIDSNGTGSSGDGSVVVGWGRTGSGFQATRWTAGGGQVGLGFLPGASSSFASDVSADGNIVVGRSGSASPISDLAFRWTASTGMVSLGDLPGGTATSSAAAISADGAFVAGSSTSANGNEAFLWSQSGGMVGLGDLAGGSFNSSAGAVSADGSVVVGTGTSTFEEAFIWTSTGGMQGLGDLPGGGNRSHATAVSADGSVVVGFGVTSVGFEAFIWTAANGMRRLEDVLVNDYGLTGVSPWVLSRATGISADGLTIVGTGIRSGVTQAWMVVLPEPGTALLVGLGLTFLGARRRNAA